MSSTAVLMVENGIIDENVVGQHPLFNEELEIMVFAAVGMFAVVMIVCLMVSCYCYTRRRQRSRELPQSARIEMVDSIDVAKCDSARTLDGMTSLGVPGLSGMEALCTPRGTRDIHVIPVSDDMMPVLPGSNTDTPEMVDRVESVDDECYREGRCAIQGIEGSVGDSDTSDQDQSCDALYGINKIHRYADSKGVTDDNVCATKTV